jgi:DNA topoisomerase-3
VKAEISGEGFRASYLTIKEMNYLEIYPFERWVQSSFPAQVPDHFHAKVDIKQNKTKPPGYLTEAELIGLMEKNQIGTDATIHEHIENIQKRSYAVKLNNSFKPTNVGAALVQTYLELQIGLPNCEIRRKIEARMNLIAEGKLGRNAAISETLQEMVPIYDKVQNSKK